MSGATNAPGVTVVAAVIEREGKILIGQRRRGEWLEFKWEFPGGKVDPYELPREAVERELWEELGIRAECGDEIMRYEYGYAGRPAILLMFYRVTEFAGEPVNHAFEQIVWVEPEELGRYDFLEGDLDFIRRYEPSSARSC